MSFSDSQPKSRLSNIDTSWSLVRRSHESQIDAAVDAQQKLLQLYGSAIKRYLIASLQDVEAAEDLFQEFALRFVQGKLKNADPSKGRFRNYVKTVLYRLIADHYRAKSARNERSLHADESREPVSAFNVTEEDQRFLISWRDELLARAWQALAELEASSHAMHYSVLRMRANDPTLSSEDLANKLTSQLGKPINSGAARVMVHRARLKYATMLIEVIAESLEEPTRANIEAELIDVRLIDYCRVALDP